MSDTPPIRFADGSIYENYMGPWSRAVGERVLDWLQPGPGLEWLDVGCGTGAFTQLIAERCTPAGLLGIDPSEGQLQFARTRPLGVAARFIQGDAMALPVPDAAVDISISALVIFFMPDPATGVAEMRRCVRPGGTVASYAWDLPGGGFPYAPVQAAMGEAGFPPSLPPHAEAGAAAELGRLWAAAGLEDIDTLEIAVSRRYPSFDAYWDVAMTSGGIRAVLETGVPDVIADIRERARAALPAAADGSVSPTARANAIRGRVPAA